MLVFDESMVDEVTREEAERFIDQCVHREAIKKKAAT